MKGNKKQQELLELRAAQAKELEIKTKIVAVKEAHITKPSSFLPETPKRK